MLIFTQNLCGQLLQSCGTRVFIKRFGWKFTGYNHGLEQDQFDTEDAVYLVVQNSQGNVVGGARLLDTSRGSLLGEIFPYLVDGMVPADPRVFEVTRFVVDHRRERLQGCGTACADALGSRRNTAPGLALTRLVSVSYITLEPGMLKHSRPSVEADGPGLRDGRPRRRCSRRTRCRPRRAAAGRGSGSMSPTPLSHADAGLGTFIRAWRRRDHRRHRSGNSPERRLCRGRSSRKQLQIGQYCSPSNIHIKYQQLSRPRTINFFWAFQYMPEFRLSELHNLGDRKWKSRPTKTSSTSTPSRTTSWRVRHPGSLRALTTDGVIIDILHCSALDPGTPACLRGRCAAAGDARSAAQARSRYRVR